ncbi:MAG: T9SS type A sorting domain-containing protein [Bacteroidota bacterium]
MKRKTFTQLHIWAVILLLMLGSGSSMFAQTGPLPVVDEVKIPTDVILKIREAKHPKLNELPGNETDPQPLPTVQAQWDQVFSYNLTDSIGGLTSLLGVAYTGSEIWVSQFNTDSVYIFNSLGQFQQFIEIPGVSRLSGLTYDGTNIYGANGSTTIYEIDPNSRTLSNTFTIPSAAIYLTYDETADGGNGGFWTGSFLNTPDDLTLVSRAGSLLSTIPNTSHGLQGIIGAAVDNTSQGGPYLWVFDQGGAPSSAVIRQINISTGMTTPTARNVAGDLGRTGALAGDLFIVRDFTTDRDVIFAIVQDQQNILIGYELDFVPANQDLSVEEIRMVEGLSRIPVDQLDTISTSGIIVNFGLDSVPAPQLVVTAVDENNFILATDTTDLASIGPSDTLAFSQPVWKPETQGLYGVFGEVLINGVAEDENSDNNLNSFIFLATDSTLSRDLGPISGIVGFEPTDFPDAILGQNFPIGVQDDMSSITFLFVPDAANLNDAIFASVYIVDPSTGQPVSVIANTFPYIVTQEDVDRLDNEGLATVVTVPFAGGPVTIPLENVFVGVNQGIAPLNLAVREEIFTPGTTWVLDQRAQGGFGWVNNERLFISGEFVYAVQPNFNFCADFKIDSTSIVADDGSGTGSASVAVSGGTPPYTYLWSVGQSNSTLENVAGGDYILNVFDDRQCLINTTVSIPLSVSIEERLQAGITELETYPVPARDVFSVDLILSESLETEVRLLTPTGQLLASQTFTNRSVLNTQFEVDHLPTGVFILQVRTEKGVINQLVAKQ